MLRNLLRSYVRIERTRIFYLVLEEKGEFINMKRQYDNNTRRLKVGITCNHIYVPINYSITILYFNVIKRRGHIRIYSTRFMIFLGTKVFSLMDYQLRVTFNDNLSKILLQRHYNCFSDCQTFCHKDRTVSNLLVICHNVYSMLVSHNIA